MKIKAGLVRIHTHGLQTSSIVAVLLAGTLALLAGCSSPDRKNDPTNSGAERPLPGTLEYDKSVFHDLLEHHEKITRTVRPIDGGLEGITESDDPAIAALLFDHVVAMKGRLQDQRRLRQWDPIYVAVFDAHDKITLDIERLPKGVRVRETSSDPKVVELIRAHGVVVSGFVRNGFDEAGREHPVPEAAQ